MRRLPFLLALLALLVLPVLAAPAAASTPPRAPVASAADYEEQPDYENVEQEPVDESDPDGSPGPDTPTVDTPPVVTPPVPSVPFEHGPEPPRAPLYPPLVTTGTVPGRVAQMRTNGKAAIPRGAPLRVRAIIAAANRIIGKRYKWGGGHARLMDSGYDCSGTVSYALIRSGELSSPLVSGSFARWGSRGAGSYVTIYANRGHVYMEVAGLRLDTSAVGDPGGRSGVRWRPAIGRRDRFAVRHVPGL
jgi:cell wall-associated NlpC family hydrolase